MMTRRGAPSGGPPHASTAARAAIRIERGSRRKLKRKLKENGGCERIDVAAPASR